MAYGNPHWKPGEPDADHARRRGWCAGTRLTGTEHYHGGRSNTETITITAIGQERLLAVCDTHGVEMTWTLRHRDWTPTPNGDEQ